MKWIKNILWLVLALAISAVILLHIGSYYIQYDDNDILSELPEADINYYDFNKTSVRSIYLDRQSDTVLIFIHGAPGSFDSFLQYLKDSNFSKYYLLAYDRPGYGGSSSSPMPSIMDQSNILLNIINEYASDHIVLISHSYGGPIAGYAAALNKIIDKVVMIAPLLDPKNEPIFWFSYFGKWSWTSWALTSDLRTCGIEKFDHAHSLKEIEPYWKQIKCPILHIHGGKDGLAPPVYNTEYSTLMIDSNYLDLQYYPNEGHLILWENFELTKKAILNFI